MRVISAAAIWLSLGCSAGAPSREDEAAKLQEKLLFVQSVACLSPATQKECDPGLTATFREAATFRERRSSAAITSSLHPDRTDRGTGSIWCEGGRPHARLSTSSGEVTGEFGQVAWEAIWRVLEATDFCASAYGGAVSVTRNGQIHACKDPRFDMHALFDIAISQAKHGPPAVVRKTGRLGDGDGGSLGDICSIDPGACPTSETRTVCPPFLGDPWNGVRAKRDDGVNGGSDAGPDDSGDMREAKEPDRRPPQGEIAKALSAVLEGARSCLKTDAPTSTATVRFGSDGAVQRVEVGNGAGPAKACIERALRRARVSSFSAPSFEVRITIRAPR
jgi:hypothetical protein